MSVFAFLSFFFFKQKTAYEMRISDWSSDVCSSDLRSIPGAAFRLSHDGGNHDSRTAYRGTARRASRHHRSGRTSPDRSGVADGAFESCGTGSDNRSMAGLIVRYEGGGGIAGRSPWLSGWLRTAELHGFGHFEGEGDLKSTLMTSRNYCA